MESGESCCTSAGENKVAGRRLLAPLTVEPDAECPDEEWRREQVDDEEFVLEPVDVLAERAADLAAFSTHGRLLLLKVFDCFGYLGRSDEAVAFTFFTLELAEFGLHLLQSR